MALPAFVDYPGNLAYQQPFIMKQLRLYGFVVDGNTENLQKMVDARLNFMDNRPDTRYFIATDKILFAFTTSPFLQSLVPKDAAMGIFTEKTFCSYTFVAECKLEKGEWWAQRILIFIPYIVVNTPLTLIGGREDYGYPKTLGEVVTPEDPKDLTSLTASTIGIRHFGPDAVSALQPFIEIGKDNTIAQAEHKGLFTELAGLWNDFKEVLSPKDKAFHMGFKFAVDEIENLWSREMNMIFLRQFRDITDPTQACYQAIIEASGKPANTKGVAKLPGNYVAKIHHMDTLPIDSDMGLSENNPVSHAFTMEFDANFDIGKEIWRGI
jgi:hypothetical protein